MVELPSSIIFPERARFARRLSAMVLDIACSFLGGWFLALFVGGTLATQFNVGDLKEAFHIGSFSVGSGAFLAFLLFVFLKSFLEPLAGASLGAFALRLHIGDEERGVLAEDSRLWIRWILKYFPLLCLFGGLIFHASWLFTIGIIVGLVLFIGFFWTLTESRQALHDVLAGTAIFHSHDHIG